MLIISIFECIYLPSFYLIIIIILHNFTKLKEKLNYLIHSSNGIYLLNKY